MDNERLDFSFVDEEGLLPGSHETTMTYGSLDNPSLPTSSTLQFSPLIDQEALIEAKMTSNEVPLYYQISEDGKTLSATQGANGPKVFEATLFDDGSYSFNLFAHLDRDIDPNLIEDPNFQSNLQKGSHQLGWKMNSSDLFSLPQSDTDAQHEIIATQMIPTKEGSPYHLSFFYGNHIPEESQVDVYWNGKLIQSLHGEQDWRGYLFSLEGGPGSFSELKIVGTQLGEDLPEYLHEVMLHDMSLKRLPIDFLYDVLQGDQITATHEFTIHVATEPPLIVHQSEPFTIVYEQSVYQSIILEEQTSFHDKPLTQLNLDTLFQNLNISDENRQVDIVQLEEEGHATNVYEVQISDKSSHFDPITVADVRLSFDGGDGGLEVFSKNISVTDI